MVCNDIKGDMMPEVWKDFCAKFPEWWKMSKLEIRDAKYFIGAIKGKRLQVAIERVTGRRPDLQQP